MEEIQDETHREIELKLRPGTQKPCSPDYQRYWHSRGHLLLYMAAQPLYLSCSPDSWPCHTLLQNGGVVPETEIRKHQT